MYIGQFDPVTAAAIAAGTAQGTSVITDIIGLFDGGDGCNAQFPPGYQIIPGQPNAATNPCTGVILWRSGDQCRIYPSPQTQSGQPMTEAQRREWGIPLCPTGPTIVRPTGAALSAAMLPGFGAPMLWLVGGGLVLVLVVALARRKR